MPEIENPSVNTANPVVVAFHILCIDGDNVAWYGELPFGLLILHTGDNLAIRAGECHCSNEIRQSARENAACLFPGN